MRLKDLATRVFSASDLEQVTCLTLLLSTLVVVSPYSDVFSNGRAYTLLSNFLSEGAFGGIVTFFFFLSLFSIIDGGLRFRFWVNVGVSIFWALQFTVFLVAQEYSGYITWLVSIFGFVAVKTCAHIANALEDVYG